MKDQRTGRYDSYFLFAVNASTIAIPYITQFGYSLCLTSNPLGATVILGLCCLILYVVVSALMRLVLLHDVSTMDIVSGYFGSRGATLCALIVGLSCFGWFMVQLDSCSKFLEGLGGQHIPMLATLSQEQIQIGLIILFVGTALFGKWGLRFITGLLVPLLLISIVGFILFFPRTLCVPKLTFGARPLSLSALSLLLNGLAAHALSTPTFYKFSFSVEKAQRSIRIIYFLILPVVCGMGIAMGILSPTEDIYELFMKSSGAWPFFVIAYFFLGAWTVSSMSLYYGGDFISFIFSQKYSTPIIAVAGGGVYFVMRYGRQPWNVTAETLGVLVVGILAVVLARSTFGRFILGRDAPRVQRDNCRALIVAGIVGATTHLHWLDITGVPFFDTAVVAFFLCLYYSRFHYQKIGRSPQKDELQRGSGA